LAELGSVLDRLPEDVAGRDLGDPEAGGGPLGLRPLPRAWWSHQDQVHGLPSGDGPSPRLCGWAQSPADARAPRPGEALVVAADEVSLDLLDRVQRDAHHD